MTTLPAKLPPLKQPLPVTSLPMLGYLEQTVATSIINALSAVGAKKPKYPFLDSTRSAQVYMAYHLKGASIMFTVRMSSAPALPHSCLTGIQAKCQ